METVEERRVQYTATTPVVPTTPYPAENVRAQRHYTQFKIQPAKFIIENDLPFAVGNVIKYVCRFERKDGLKDLEKAKHYLDMLIAQKSGKGVDSVLG